MKKIYTAAHMQEATIISDLLKSAGIDCVVKNAQMQTIMGEVPFTETFPTIWVPEEASAEAEAIISAKPITLGSVWTCSKCQEECEPQFTACWQCGQQRKK